MMDDTIYRQAAIEAMGKAMWAKERLAELPSAEPEQKSCKTCHLWEDGELNIACPWGSNYEHYEDDYCSLWEKQN